LLATSDKNGNLIIWKISNSSQFKILTEIENLSESNITYMLWSHDGNFLFASNSYGSVYILEFNEYFKTPVKSFPSNENINNLIISDLNRAVSPVKNSSNLKISQDINTKRRIAPEMVNTNTNLQTNVIQKAIGQESNPHQLVQECLRCLKQKLDMIENKIVKFKLESFENKDIFFLYENKVYDNYCTIELRMKNNSILYANKLDNKLIRIFTCNNNFYAFYDTNNSLNVFTLLNTMVKIKI
jgi:WD40 repeat protein